MKYRCRRKCKYCSLLLGQSRSCFIDINPIIVCFSHWKKYRVWLFLSLNVPVISELGEESALYTFVVRTDKNN